MGNGFPWDKFLALEFFFGEEVYTTYEQKQQGS